eukprot:scaffold97463_cov72-Phaeocystis_antarctica.AAC.2
MARRSVPGARRTGCACLELVAQDVVELRAVGAQHLRLLLEEPERAEGEVRVVERVARAQRALVLRVDRAREGDETPVLRVGRLCGAEALLLPQQDLLQHGGLALVAALPGGGGQRVRRAALLERHQLAHDLPLLALWQDREAAGQVKELVVLADHARADGVERPQPHALRVGQRPHAGPQLRDGVLREGDGEDAIAGHTLANQQVRHARAQHARLACARAGEHEHSAVVAPDRLRLQRVREQRLCACERRVVPCVRPRGQHGPPLRDPGQQRGAPCRRDEPHGRRSGGLLRAASARRVPLTPVPSSAVCSSASAKSRSSRRLDAGRIVGLPRRSVTSET